MSTAVSPNGVMVRRIALPFRRVGWRATRNAESSNERNWNGDGSPMPLMPYGRNPSGRRSRPRVSKRPRSSSLPILTRRKAIYL